MTTRAEKTLTLANATGEKINRMAELRLKRQDARRNARKALGEKH